MTCPAVSVLGTPCALDDGHGGDHKGHPTSTGFVPHWNDAGEQTFITQHSSRFD